jgi:uncharacterized membrane protein
MHSSEDLIFFSPSTVMMIKYGGIRGVRYIAATQKKNAYRNLVRKHFLGDLSIDGFKTDLR